MTKTYHTSLKKDTYPYVHETYASVVYALDLLHSELPENTERAADILSVILRLQDTQPDSPTYGIWPYYEEEPLDRMDAPDYNFADFIGKKLVLALKHYGERLDERLRHGLSKAISRACQAIMKRDVAPSYTNIAAMGAFVTLVGGEVIGEESIMFYGRNRLQRLHDFTMRLGTFVEFNSPRYTPITIEEIHHLRQETSDPVSIQLADRLLFVAWQMLAERYHPRTKEWAGPHSRSYHPMLRKSSLEHDLLNSVIERDADSRIPRCPKPLLPFFEMERESSLRCPILDEAESGYQSYATTYMKPAYSLGSFSKEMMWDQRYNLIAYVDNKGQAAYVRLRFLKDGKDFSSAVFTSAQHKSDILFGINMALDFGDWHPVLDPVNGVIEANDLRIRIEVGGWIDGVQHVPGESDYDAAVKIGEQTVRVKQLGAYSDLGASRMEIIRSELEGTLGIDYILYEGPKTAFDFHDWKEAAWVFLFTMSEQAEELRSQCEVEGGAVRAWCGKDGRQMGIALPVKPDRIQRLFRQNEVLFMEDGKE
jgi:hypothetical protein